MLWEKKRKEEKEEKKEKGNEKIDDLHCIARGHLHPNFRASLTLPQ